MKKLTIKQQLKILKKAAKKRGLVIRKSNSLKNTQYRAMNPLASKELHIKNPKYTISYTAECENPKRRLPMDLRHEIIEYDAMKKRGMKYKTAHKVANRKQRSILSVK